MPVISGLRRPLRQKLTELEASLSHKVRPDLKQIKRSQSECCSSKGPGLVPSTLMVAHSHLDSSSRVFDTLC